MNRDELKSLVSSCLNDQDKLMQNIDVILDTVDAVFAENEALKDEKVTLTEKNDTLRQECQKWINRAGIVTIQPEEEDKKETYQELSNRLKAKMKGIF